MSRFYIEGPSLKPWYNYLDKLSEEPRVHTRLALNAIMQAAYVTAGINTHVETGRLRASLHMSTEHRKSPRRNVWTGELSLGQGLRYAKYELGDRRRGIRPDWAVHPSHDPYDGLGELYYPAIDAVLSAIG